MKATLKKSMALATVFTVAAMSTITANATNAAINGATASYSTTTLTVTKVGAFTAANEITFASVKKLDGTAATVTVSSYAGNNSDSNTSDITLSADPSTTDNNSILVVSFVTAQGDFGTAQLTVGSPTANTVSITANVVPTLSLALANTNVALGSLDPASVIHSATDPTATVKTNAVSGFTLSVDSANDGLHSATASHTIGAGATGAGSEGYALNVTMTADPQTNGSVVASPSLSGGATTIAQSSGPTSGVQATVDVAASISAITPAAGDYADTLTFTVTGSF